MYDIAVSSDSLLSHALRFELLAEQLTQQALAKRAEMQQRRECQAAINAESHAHETAQVMTCAFVALCAAVHPPCLHLSLTVFVPLYLQGEHDINAAHTTQVHFLCYHVCICVLGSCRLLMLH